MSTLSVVNSVSSRRRPVTGSRIVTWAIVALCVALVALAIFGPMLAPYDPSQTDILNRDLGSSPQHLLGTDSLGRDLLSRILVGARLSLISPAIVVFVATTVGTAIAIAGVWFGGWFDRVVSRVTAVLFAFPSLLVAVLAVAVFGAGLIAPITAIAIVYIPYIARIVRSVALRERHMPYIDACLGAGFSGWSICTRHILPNVMPLIRAQATIAYGAALIDLAGVSFLGLGAQPPTAEWGLMVGDGRSGLLNGNPQEAVVAGTMIVVTVVAFNLLGDRIARGSDDR